MSQCTLEGNEKTAPASSMMTSNHSSAPCVRGVVLAAAETRQVSKDG